MYTKQFRGIWWLAVVVFLAVTVYSCKPKKEDGNFKVTLRGYFGSQPLSFSSIYDAGDGKQYYFSKLKFFLSHITLIRTDNTEVEINPVAYFEFGSSKWSSFTAKAPAGDYKGIKLSVGLDPSQNNTEPDNYPADNPLGPKEDMFWSWLKHRFINLEGRGDTITGNFVNGVGLVYHVGLDTCYRTTILSNGEFTIADEDKEMFLHLDLKKVFSGSADAIDFYTEPGTQSEPGDLPTAIRFANKFSESFEYSEQ